MTLKVLKQSLFLLLITISVITKGQNGHYIKPFSSIQFTSLANSRDYYTSGVTMQYESTYHFGYGVNYVFNATDIFGLEMGINYVNTGQKYSGFIDESANPDRKKNFYYNSEVELSYLSFPFTFNFNSRLDEESVFLTIGAGFQLDILNSASMMTDPEPTIDPQYTIDTKEFFKNINASFTTSAMFNFLVTKNWFITSGFKMNRTIGDIEDKSIIIDKINQPVEYRFPISTSKNFIPDVSQRTSTKNINYCFVLGISYFLGEAK